MIKNAWILLVAALFAVAGCATTEEPKPAPPADAAKAASALACVSNVSSIII
jgi:hypothetical protein